MEVPIWAFGSGKLYSDPQTADEVDGWEMTSISARLLEAQGAYRSPDEKGFLFLLYDALEFIPEDQKGPYMPLKRANKAVDSTPGDAPRDSGGSSED